MMLDWTAYHAQILQTLGEMAKLSPDTLRGYRVLSDELISLRVAVTARYDGRIVVHPAAALKHGASREETCDRDKRRRGARHLDARAGRGRRHAAGRLMDVRLRRPCVAVWLICPLVLTVLGAQALGAEAADSTQPPRYRLPEVSVTALRITLPERETDLVYTGAVDWCVTVQLAEGAQIRSVAAGQPRTGGDPKAVFGKLDSTSLWAGWLTATNAFTGKRVWRFKSPTPLLSGVTPTAGGLDFFGDMNGRLYAVDARNGRTLWSYDTGGAIGGGVISYVTGGKQRIAVCSGMTSPIWPTADATAKIIVFSLD